MISVALPFNQNSHGILPLAIQSVFSQTYDDWELLLMADSPDVPGLEEIRRISDPRVRLVADGQVRGIAARLNQAVQLAQGDLLARMTPDVLMMPNRLQLQTDAQRREKDCTLIGSAVVTLDREHRAIAQYIPPKRVESQWDFLKGESVYGPTLMGPTGWFSEHPYDENEDEIPDFDFCARYGNQLSVYNVEIPLLAYPLSACSTCADLHRQNRLTKNTVRREGRRLGKFAAARLMFRHRLRHSLFAVAHTLQMEPAMILPGSRTVHREQMGVYAQRLERVYTTPVPGWKNHRHTPSTV